MTPATLGAANVEDEQQPWSANGVEPYRRDGRAQLCVRELDQIHALIAWYDEEVMRKKSWAIAVWAIVSAYGVQSASALIVMIGLATLLGFAASDLILRRYQCRYFVRAEQLESLLAAGALNDYRYSLADVASHSDRRREFRYALFQLHFSLFYGFFATISAASAFYLAR